MLQTIIQSLQIMFDGRNFSDQSAILKQGLSDTITPPEGIIAPCLNGTIITLNGSDLVRNTSVGHHVHGNGYYQGTSCVLADTYV